MSAVYSFVPLTTYLGACPEKDSETGGGGSKNTSLMRSGERDSMISCLKDVSYQSISTV